MRSTWTCGRDAIEDKLQNGVPEAIAAMRHGGVKVWVLTGDKVDTAINIGYACEVMTADMLKLELTCKNKEVKAKLELDADGRPTANCLRNELTKAIAAAKDAVQKKSECVVVLDTYFLTAISDHAMGNEFLALANMCKSVVAARVSPDQRRDCPSGAPEAVTNGNDALVTLAIGDGANDVTMIKEAHIGVGIDGLEGKQAVNNSDMRSGSSSTCSACFLSMADGPTAECLS